MTKKPVKDAEKDPAVDVPAGMVITTRAGGQYIVNEPAEQKKEGVDEPE